MAFECVFEEAQIVGHWGRGEVWFRPWFLPAVSILSAGVLEKTAHCCALLNESGEVRMAGSTTCLWDKVNGDSRCLRRSRSVCISCAPGLQVGWVHHER